MSNLIVASSAASSTRSGFRNSPFSSGGCAASASLRSSSTGFSGLIRNVSPSSPSSIRRLNTTLAASTFVALPFASRVKISFSPWYRPAVGREAVDVLRFFLQRVEEDPLDQRVELAVLLEDEQRVVVPAVLADQPAEVRGRLGRRCRRALSLAK